MTSYPARTAFPALEVFRNRSRKTYSRPVPADAAFVKAEVRRRGKAVRVEAVRFKGDDGKTVTAPLVTSGPNAGRHCLVAAPNWYGRVGGKVVPLCASKCASEILLGDLVRQAANRRAGIGDAFEAHTIRPLAGHLEDYRRELMARDDEPRYVRLVASRLRALFDGCGFRLIPDLSLSRAMDWLATLRRDGRAGSELPPGQEQFTRSEAAALLGMTPTAFRDAVKRHRLDARGKGPARRYPRATLAAVRDRAGRGLSVQTTNYYVSHLKSFCRWMVKDRRMADDPVAHLEAINAAVDRRHDRRELTADELRRLLDATRSSPRPFRGLGGDDRFHLYATACGTGLRAAALASLTPESFSLGGEHPTVTLAAKRNKSRRKKEQPLPTGLAALLRAYLAGKPAGQAVWPGGWAGQFRAAEMLRADLAAAGIPYEVQAADGTPLFADFHALRHSYITALGRSGVDLRVAQELAGHSTPALTARYMHVSLRDMAGAVEKMPNVLPAPRIATERRA